MRVTGAPCVQAAPQSREPQCPPLPPPPEVGGPLTHCLGAHLLHRLIGIIETKKALRGGDGGQWGDPGIRVPLTQPGGGEVLAHLDCQGVMTPSSGPPISTRLWIRSRFRFQSGVNKGLTRGCRHPIVHLGVGGGSLEVL